MSTTRSTQTITAAGFNTAYVEAGDPANDTIVLIHDGGFGTTAELCWGPMIDLLSDEYHVVAPELLGWGGTDKVVFLDRSPYAGRIPHIAAFCEAKEITDAYFIGASFGGSLLLRALTAPGAPWPVRAAVSIGGTGGPFRLSDGIAALGEYTPSLEEAARLTSYMATSLDDLGDHIKSRYENSLIPGHWESLMAPRLSNPSVEKKAVVDPFLDDWTRVDVPVLLVEGSQDRLLEDGWSASLAGMAPNADFAVVDYAHEANIQAPAEMVELADAFFQKVQA